MQGIPGPGKWLGRSVENETAAVALDPVLTVLVAEKERHAVTKASTAGTGDPQ